MFKSGFVSLIGRPNVGKSSLMSRILGQKISIISDKPQTTRNRIVGVWNLPDAQVAFIDTPGIHQGRSAINQYMLGTANTALGESDLVLFMVDFREIGGPEFDLGVRMLREQAPPNVFLVINKIDLAQKDQQVLEAIVRLKDVYAFREIVPLSALDGHNVERLQDLILAQLDEGPAFFPTDSCTDQSERFLVAEFIREKIFRYTHEEVPHAVAVTVDAWEEADERIEVSATVHVERQSQKGIIIGKGGAMARRVRLEARRDLKRLLGIPVDLEIFVRVSHDWRKLRHRLREFGYSDDC